MIKKHVFTFQNALSGIIWTFKTQNNIRIHLFFSALALIGGFVLKISTLEFFVILVLIGGGLAIETLNTAIEEAIDAIHKDWSEEIKIAKDVSAGAMLIFALTALFIAGFIFIPKIFSLFTL
ncbi:hypothetical protein A2767_00050 [Candidatus Roizmanbacteria bacterium RIFCSPHIGHO2_01_FULL_35_10]|uniref:Diacylglycerol kinase n=1 Tax=Candidatus Roizmanbacteria bacterium RIFCSPLOWO2_01_FULL_35_13 TaxID=1802055 RepID=A0A1F7IH94_9BACT|nr:MAG: hypothetical protein A2767_00050 [Candidatus Roizmanbacteria bacterium RIFCSPHIGHO2_01_FULL_35_10]OGK42744.1 MAG: hypothetical protein A3A74_00840 [Candidatus Roizmanbacteria bacterium RIFCSPLOWO2_01_FULL_35_13]